MTVLDDHNIASEHNVLTMKPVNRTALITMHARCFCRIFVGQQHYLRWQNSMADQELIGYSQASDLHFFGILKLVD